mmetsp:Transcript_15183/g.28286  ORF Transcript_15183/g.28286 Transcript_15183/m.28286 type:complete len:237 (-) Transcript_15183:7144-7854(-)
MTIPLMVVTRRLFRFPSLKTTRMSTSSPVKITFTIGTSKSCPETSPTELFFFCVRGGGAGSPKRSMAPSSSPSSPNDSPLPLPRLRSPSLSVTIIPSIETLAVITSTSIISSFPPCPPPLPPPSLINVTRPSSLANLPPSKVWTRTPPTTFPSRSMTLLTHVPTRLSTVKGPAMPSPSTSIVTKTPRLDGFKTEVARSAMLSFPCFSPGSTTLILTPVSFTILKYGITCPSPFIER